MKSYIKSIIIFNENGEKRIVPLKQGVNIITGESKTGKSALVEIIDYCLCSTRCTIPKGKITEFAYLYALVMHIDGSSYIVARYTGDNMYKMHFIKESYDFDTNTLELVYFKDRTPIPYKDVQYEIECALGLFVSNVSTDSEEKEKKASLRNMVSYLFQHQNLMASKFALFYRFSDYYKRKEVIDQFPVFAGMIGQEYYSDLIQLSTLKSKLKQKEKKTSVYKGYKQDKIEMRGDRAEMSDFPLYLNMVAGGLDRRDQTIGGFSFVVKIYAVPVVEIIG